MKNSIKQESLDKKNKIMLIVPMLHQGGFERICAMTAKLLNDRYDIYLVVFTLKDKFYDVQGINVINLELGALDGKINKIKQIVKRINALKKLKRELGIQISYSFGTSANLVNVLSKTKDITWAGIRGYGALNEHMNLISKKASRVVSCTKVMETEIIDRFHPHKSATLYNPCNIDEIRKLADQKIDSELKAFIDKPGSLIVTLGREDDLKGYWHLIKSFSVLQKEMPDVKLMIIGDGEFTEYKKLADELEINSICFAGVHKNPFAIIKHADIYTLTSESEGFPNALIEAMAVGVPVLSVNCKTGPAEILCDNYNKAKIDDMYSDYGVLVPTFTGTKNMNADDITKEEEKFAEYMKELLLNSAARNLYSEKGRQRAKDFSIEAYVNNIENLIIEDLCKQE